MRFLIAIITLGAATHLKADAESYLEPSAQQSDVLSKAILASPLRSHYSDKEKTAYYLRDAVFMARVKTNKGYLLVFRFTFIRSSPYRKDTITPPRGHTFAVVFDDPLKSVWYREANMPDDLQLNELKLTAKDQWTVDLEELILKKTEQDAAANP